MSGRYQDALVQYRSGQYQAASTILQELLLSSPDNPDVWSLSGLNSACLGERPLAVEQLEQAVELAPTCAKYDFNLGIIHEQFGDKQAAEHHYRTAISKDPEYGSPYNNLASVCCSQGRLAEAVDLCQQGLHYCPDQPELWNCLGSCYAATGRAGEALEFYRKAMELAPDNPDFHSNFVFCMNYSSAITDSEFFEEHRRWAELHADPIPSRTSFNNDRSHRRRLRVGYVSADFHRHSVAFFIEPVLFFHDKTRFDVICYSDVVKPDEVTKRISDIASEYVDIKGQSDQVVADRIVADRIDILVDLGAHTGKRLGVFARKPAPIQITYLGCPNSTGMKTVDYRLTDSVADPEVYDQWYVEKQIRLPDGFLCFAPPGEAPDLVPSPALGNGFVTFGSFNNLAKVTPQVLSTWAQILQDVPDSRLLLKNRSLLDEETKQRIHKHFQECAIDAERIELLGFTRTLTEHLDLYNRIDIALDTFPYNGVTTTCEALWMGVPVVALLGDRHGGRVAASLLSRVEMQSWIASTQDHYIELAIDRARDIGTLNKTRSNLRDHMAESTLCNGQLFVENLERVYRAMWKDWLEQ